MDKRDPRGQLKYFPYTWDKQSQNAHQYMMNYCPNACNLRASLNPSVRPPPARLFHGRGMPPRMHKVDSCNHKSTCYHCRCLSKTQRNETDTGRKVEGVARRDNNTSSGQGIRTNGGRGTYTEDLSECPLGNCCPNEQQRQQGVVNQLGRYTVYTGCLLGDRGLAIVRCPETWLDDVTRSACETNKPRLLDEAVTDKASGVTFRNKDCATCHGVKSYTPWRFTVDCYHWHFFHTLTSEEQLINLTETADFLNLCQVNYVTPRGVRREACHSDFIKPDKFISTCNETGAWSNYDADVVELCYTLPPALTYRLSVNMIVFKNMFCALCNGMTLLQKRNCLLGPRDLKTKEQPLTFLLGLGQGRGEQGGRKEDGEGQGCPSGQWQLPGVSVSLVNFFG